jgi:prepilin-type N-terminal cleavage/methylation domain-containing protein
MMNTQNPHRNEKGFTLIELMLVVAIIGILAVVAIPLFGGLVKRSKTTEVKSCLGEIRMLEEAFFAETDTYIGCPPMQDIPAGLHTDGDADRDNMAPIGFHPKGVSRYSYTINPADSSSFLSTGEGNIDDDAPTDRWTINERAALTHAQID